MNLNDEMAEELDTEGVDITGRFTLLYDDDDDELFQAALAAFLALECQNTRVFKWNVERLNWEEHRQRLIHQNQFNKMYRMSPEAFEVLVSIIREKIQVDVKMSLVSTLQSNAAIYPELVADAGIRYICGGHIHDITSYIGISYGSIYRILEKFDDAVLESTDPQLQITWPKTAEECAQIAEGFKQKSGHGLMNRCVSAKDGLLPQIGRPTLKETDNADAYVYFSGHYSMYGLNCQGVCDSLLWFTFFAIAAPGKTGDAKAMYATNLPQLIDALPLLYYLVADVAYVLSDKVLTPFKGQQGLDGTNSSFNFYLSQIRIRIEMAFGCLTTKFRILRGGLVGPSLAKASKIIQVCTRLHNFIINVDNPDDDLEIEPMLHPTTGQLIRTEEEWQEQQQEQAVNEDKQEEKQETPSGLGYLPTAEEDDLDTETQVGTSRVRDAILH